MFTLSKSKNWFFKIPCVPHINLILHKRCQLMVIVWINYKPIHSLCWCWSNCLVRICNESYTNNHVTKTLTQLTLHKYPRCDYVTVHWSGQHIFQHYIWERVIFAIQHMLLNIRQCTTCYQKNYLHHLYTKFLYSVWYRYNILCLKLKQKMPVITNTLKKV